MTLFDDKILLEIENPKIKRNHDFFLWVDYVEILCLSSVDSEVTFSVLDVYFNPDKGLHIDEEMIDDLVDDQEISMIDKASINYADLSSTFRVRASIFGDSYPFVFKNDLETLFLKKKLENKHFLYIFLLISGNLRFLRNDIRSCFTKDFERIATDALMQLFPSPWEWRHFGTANHPKVKSYKGKKIDKLKSMSSDINAQLIAPESDFPKTDSGDAGFDFMCFCPFEKDEASHLPLVFAQSGCSADKNEIYDKQRSVSLGRVRNFFSRIHSYSIMVTPECFRNALGTWPNVTEISTVFIDRSRIINLLEEGGFDFIDEMESVKRIKNSYKVC